MDPREQQDDNDDGTANRGGEIMFHSPGDFRDKGRPAGITYRHIFKGGVCLHLMLHPGFDPVQPGDTGTVAGQIFVCLNKNDPKRPVSRREVFLSPAEHRRGASAVLRQTRQAKRIVAELGDFIG